MESKVQIKNYMENLVANQLESIMKKNNYPCFCDICKADITALALSHFPAQYCTTEKGDRYAKLNSYEYQSIIDVVTAITNAIEIVEKHPRHNINE